MVDANGWWGSNPAGGRVLKIDPGTGAQSIISSGGYLKGPWGLAIDARGDIIVSDRAARAIIRVDPQDGSQTVISSGGLFDENRDLVIDANGDLLVADIYYKGGGGNGGIIKVDPVTGAQSVAAAGGYINYPSDVTLDAAGNMYVTGSSATGPGALVVRIDATTGAQTLISSGGSSDFWPAGIFVTATGRIFITEIAFPNGIFEVDPVTGAQTVRTRGYPLHDPMDMDMDSSGTLIVADRNVYGPGGIITVNPTSWATTVLSSGNLLVDPWDVAVMPKLTIEVEIDVKPGSDPNAVNPKSTGVIPVAILTTGTFDATDVDPDSVEFGPDGAAMDCKKAHFEDVDDDGDTDLLLHFRTRETGVAAGDTRVTLTGATKEGHDIIGTDSIKTVGGGKENT